MPEKYHVGQEVDVLMHTGANALALQATVQAVKLTESGTVVLVRLGNLDLLEFPEDSDMIRPRFSLRSEVIRLLFGGSGADYADSQITEAIEMLMEHRKALQKQAIEISEMLNRAGFEQFDVELPTRVRDALDSLKAARMSNAILAAQAEDLRAGGSAAELLRRVFGLPRLPRVWNYGDAEPEGNVTARSLAHPDMGDFTRGANGWKSGVVGPRPWDSLADDFAPLVEVLAS